MGNSDDWKKFLDSYNKKNKTTTVKAPTGQADVPSPNSWEAPVPKNVYSGSPTGVGGRELPKYSVGQLQDMTRPDVLLSDSRGLPLPGAPIRQGIGLGSPGQLSQLIQSFKGSGGGGSKSSGSGGPSTIDLINQLYDSLSGRVGEIKEGALGGYDSTKETIKKQYGVSGEDLYNRYLNSRNTMIGASQNLGVNYTDSSLDLESDASLKRLQEVGDLSLDSDLSWVDKMKSLRGDLFDQIELGVERDRTLKIEEARARAAAMAAARLRAAQEAASRTNTTLTEDADKDSTIYNEGDFAAIQALKARDLEAGLLAEKYYLDNNFDVREAIGAASRGSVYTPDNTKAYVPSKKMISPTFDFKLPGAGTIKGIPKSQADQARAILNAITYSKNVTQNAKTAAANKVLKQKADASQRALDALISFSGYYGNPNTKLNTGSKTTKKTKG